MDASDDRDRLYGVMGLATDAFLLQVDYSLKAEEVYKRFTECFIRYHKSLDIICFASRYTPPPGAIRPSWVPDWQKLHSEVIPSLTSQSSKSHIGNLRSPTFIDSDPLVYYSASGNKRAVFAFDGSSLQLRGVAVDIIDGLAGSRQFDMVQSSEWTPTQAASVSSSLCFTTTILESVCRCIAFDRSDRFLRYPMPLADFLRDFRGLLSRLAATSKEPVPQDLLDWFQWTRFLQIQGRSFEDIVRNALHTDEDPLGTAPNMDEFQQDTFFGRFFDTVVRLAFRLMVSRSGRIGMVVEKAMKGDIICVLYGCSVPVVLRESVDRGKYTLVGECYLDGCMDGSFLDHAGPQESKFILL
ncbi:hypothetical protein NQ176_g11155 [Zarea fungicola]|uniref:Uncharacterized protein n=1 Tax=Zarea fungicola TaxID=93591 RepID=A0ACC1MDW3_9HYPO|nr:hypothetical protein NQ176_g11155 [Lecanicillium fungicola]